mmetsp:Transcript_55826/g.135243  ORF Transcript_55826/g.135243 Transcript_55826/m.135243 type:complete len:443 (-) Transcript_55826:39-1367(-)
MDDSHLLPVAVTLGGGTISKNVDERRRMQNDLLQQNLRRFGWSPIRIVKCHVPPPTQNEIRSCFQSNLSDCDHMISYIVSESGSTTKGKTSKNPLDNSRETVVEPKESYEVKLKDCYDDTKDRVASTTDDIVSVEDVTSNTSSNMKASADRIKQWCRAMSWIAKQVVNELDIPSDIFLSDTSPEASLDLLRVFHYFPVKNEQNKTNSSNNDSNQDRGSRSDDTISSAVLGSSPHTDWGSLTIVWQDHVVGLQTYCRDKDQWVNVPPPPLPQSVNTADTESSSSYCWECIVHVGDMASLVLGRKITANGSNPDDCSTVESNLQDCCFPSPKHRVVNSSIHDRTSLVYFGYPPADKSLDDLENSLKEWKQQNHHHTGSRLPYKEYYLLQDQSATKAETETNDGGDKNNKSSKNLPPSPEQALFESIRHRPVGDVVQMKWQQVQR